MTSFWKTYTDNLTAIPELGFQLDLSQAGNSTSLLDAYENQFQQAFLSMQHLEAGHISNPDEDRRVGHYWLRAPQLAPDPELTQLIIETRDRIMAFSEGILNRKLLSPSGAAFTDLLLIGIGGSALGPQLLDHALASNTGLRTHFIDNTDPAGMDRVLNTLEDKLSTTLFLVISKSGGTAETRNGMLEVKHFVQSRGLNFSSQAIAVTGEGSALSDMAVSEKWLEIFPMWDWVGGRTSIMSAVGLLPAALMGLDTSSFLRGAQIMDERTRTPTLSGNPAALLALGWLVIGASQGKKDMVILPYKDQLLLFSRYLQQLIMESLGKRLDLDGRIVHQGITVYGNKGSTDQHAYVQQLRDGLDNFFVTFIEVLQDRTGPSINVDGSHTSGDYLSGFYQGTRTALAESNRALITITIDTLNETTLGALIALFERAVGLYASIININAYHQPGVEAGKKAAGRVLEVKARILDLLRENYHPLTISEIAEHLDLPGEEVMIYQILRHYAQNNALPLSGSIYEPFDLKVGPLK